MTWTEETKDNWTHGKLNGKWAPNAEDMYCLYTQCDDLDDEDQRGINRNEYWAKPADIKTAFFYTAQEMTLPMLSSDSLKYNILHRARCFNKMLAMPWDEALLNAFHNFHFVCYMKDMVPEFGKKMQIANTPYTYTTSLLGTRIFLLKMLYESAAETIGELFRTDTKQECRIATEYYENDTQIGMLIHVVGTSLLYITVGLYPVYSPSEKKFDCNYSVDICAESWQGDSQSLFDVARHTPYASKLMDMQNLVLHKLKKFNKALRDAPFNQPNLQPDDN